jgi:plastocyanin
VLVRKSLAMIAVVIPLALAACGDDDDDDTTAAATAETTTEETTTTDDTAAAGGGGGGGEELTISETEFALDPANPTVAAGKVTITAVNDGATVHNLEVEGNGVEEITDDLNPGDSGELTLDLEPGEYEIYCAIGSHAAQGMEGTLTVE